jgi:hypothetical protein
VSQGELQAYWLGELLAPGGLIRLLDKPAPIAHEKLLYYRGNVGTVGHCDHRDHGRLSPYPTTWIGLCIKDAYRYPVL